MNVCLTRAVVTANREVLITSLPIRYRHQELAAAGLTPAEAAEQVQVALYGEEVAEVNQGTRRYSLVVRLDASERERVEQVQDLMLRGSAEDGKPRPTVRQRELIVGKTLSLSAAVSSRMTWAGGSSSVFRKALAALRLAVSKRRSRATL